jgi:hypothetical protein
MLPKRPDLDEYAELTDDLATYKDRLAAKKNELDSFIALCIREALKSGSKTKDVDYIKIIGRNDADKEKIELLRREIRELERLISSTFGKMETWRWGKELYISDAYHQIR